MLANILYILSAVLPPCAAYGAHQYMKWQASRESNTAAYNQSVLALQHDKTKSMAAEQTAALLANADDVAELKTRVRQLELLCEEQQMSLNRLADR